MIGGAGSTAPTLGLSLAACMASLLACGGTQAESRGAHTATAALPRSELMFDLPLLSGGHLHSKDLRGKYVVIKPFAAWCHPCWLELPALIAFSQRHSALEVVGISMDKERAATEHLVEELRVPFRVAVDPDGSLGRTLGMDALSELFLFDATGHAVAHYKRCNAASLADLERHLP